MTNKATPLAGSVTRTDALLHYIPLLREAAAAMSEDDPQEDEDQHVKEVKKRTETQTGTSDGR